MLFELRQRVVEERGGEGGGGQSGMHAGGEGVCGAGGIADEVELWGSAGVGACDESVDKLRGLVGGREGEEAVTKGGDFSGAVDRY